MKKSLQNVAGSVATRMQYADIQKDQDISAKNTEIKIKSVFKTFLVLDSRLNKLILKLMFIKVNKDFNYEIH